MVSDFFEKKITHLFLFFFFFSWKKKNYNHTVVKNELKNHLKLRENPQIPQPTRKKKKKEKWTTPTGEVFRRRCGFFRGLGAAVTGEGVTGEGVQVWIGRMTGEKGI